MSIIPLIISIILIKFGIEYNQSNLFWTATITSSFTLLCLLMDLAAFLRWKDK